MKKKTISLLLSTCIMAIAITGCSANGEFGPSDADSSAGASEQSSDTAAQEASTAQDASTAQEGTDDAGKGTGGTPWIDSDIKENVTADTKTDPKDDFCLYVNKDWILENNIPDGYSEWSHYAERSLEVKKQCMELLKDESLTGHDAELVQTFNKLVLDWDSRNKLGVSELTDKYSKIAEAQSIDDISLYIRRIADDHVVFPVCRKCVEHVSPEENTLSVDSVKAGVAHCCFERLF